jgi:hypothetical protein
MKCRACNAEIAANALICYKCGTATQEPRITPPTARPKRRWLPAAVLLAGLLLAAVAREVGCGSLL